jgi:hypothetical protein
VDEGDPISYGVLEKGTPVFSSDGQEVGTVAKVLAVPAKDIFDGIVIETRRGPGGRRFVDAPEVGAIHERAVHLKIDSAECESLPAPGENPATMEVGPEDTVSRGGGGLRRLWDRLSGR